MNNFNSKDYEITPHQTKVDKPWGYEVIYTPEKAPAVGKILYVIAGKRLSLQYHDQKVETLCLFSGEAKLTLTDSSGKEKEIMMEKEKGYFVQPGQVHRVEAITNIIFLESSTPEMGNTYRLQDDSGRITETEEMRKKERA